MSNLSITQQIITTAREQHRLIKNALNGCFDTGLQGLNETFNSVNELYDKDTWFTTRMYHVTVLKNSITRIQSRYDQLTNGALEEFNKQKKHCKEILMAMINELEQIVNTNEIRKYLADISVTLSNIIDNDPIFSMFRTGSIFDLIWEFIRLSSPDIVQRTFGASTFQDKLKDLMNKINNDRSNIRERREANLSKIAHYFDSFIDKLSNTRESNVNNMVKIVWYDAAVNNDENQSYIRRIQEKFSNYSIEQCVDENNLIQLIKFESKYDVILLTSGKSGQSIIDQIGYYWNLKGIIIYCSNVTYHQTWATPYKKITLVTNRFSDVLDEIQNIIDGKSYFILKGFTYDDINLNLKTKYNPKYYLSSVVNDGFIISNFNEINLNLNHQKQIMQQLYDKIQMKNIYHDQFPNHFQLSNLFSVAEHFVQAFNTHSLKPIENQIIRLYSESRPCLYKIVNDILNLLDEELILLIGDYIKTLRYSLIKYVDKSSKMENMKIYRGIYLNSQSTEYFLKKFKIHDHIIFPSFLSTTIDKATALQFSQEQGVLLEIVVNATNSTGGNIPKCIKEISAFPSEDEILLNCFSMMKVNNITKIKENFYLYACTLQTFE